jgi:hypothetical protein
MEKWVIIDWTYRSYSNEDTRVLIFKVLRPPNDCWLRTGESFESCSGSLSLHCEKDSTAVTGSS